MVMDVVIRVPVSLSLSINCSLVGRVYIPAPTAFLIAQLWNGAQTWP
jgi:hypothetical protein